MQLQVYLGDITQLQVDAIVNAANSSLLGGGGVDGAIHRAAGPDLQAACAKLGGCPTGQAKITPGFSLPAKYIIHTVGPVYHGDASDARLLAACYEHSLQLAEEYELNSVAFSAISTGVYGYPKSAAARIAVKTVDNWLRQHQSRMKIVFCVFDEENERIYQQLLNN
jgi:O-acetyl-ADP-ribose deacetylase (regulator of RNase III)